MTRKQVEAFKQGEGDNWFARNRAYLESAGETFDVAYIARTLETHRGGINRIVEVGSGNGLKLDTLCKFFDADGLGIEPSPEAVAAGNARVGEGARMRLTVGTADELPADEQSVDLLFFGFCLCWVDRSDLFRAVAEADRVLRPGGFLVILDFDAAHPHRRPYHHHEGVFSYKQDHSTIFLASGLYSLAGKTSQSHGSAGFAEDSDERIAVSILYKERSPLPDHVPVE